METKITRNICPSDVWIAEKNGKAKRKIHCISITENHEKAVFNMLIFFVRCDVGDIVTDIIQNTDV